MELSTPKLDMATSKPPMFITIGPQCSGKTTFLQSLSAVGLSVVDVTLDDQRNVYIPVDTRFFLYEDLEDPTITRDDITWLQNKIQGKTIAYRLFQEGGNDELRLVLQRLQGLISDEEFEIRILQMFERQNQNNDPPTVDTRDGDDALMYQQVAQDLIQVVEIVTTTKVPLPDVTQLFIVESLFRPSETQKMTGIEMATAQLEKASQENCTVAVACGNTNARPRDYRCALEIASSTDRPVIFITNADISGIVPECANGLALSLTNVPFSTLLQRNLDRLLKTGKYVPSKTMWDSLQRSNNLLVTAAEQVKRQKMAIRESSHDIPIDDTDDSEQLLHLELDQQLARLVSFEMKLDRTVQPLPFQQSARQERPRRNNEKDSYSYSSRGGQQQTGYPNDGHYSNRVTSYPNRQEAASNGRGNDRGYNRPGQFIASGRGSGNGMRAYNQPGSGGQRTTAYPNTREMPSNRTNSGRGSYPTNNRLPGQNQTGNQTWQRGGNDGRGPRDIPGRSYQPNDNQVQQRQNPWFNSQNNQDRARNDPNPPRQHSTQGDTSGDNPNKTN